MTGLVNDATLVAESARAFSAALDRTPAEQAVALQELEQAARTWAARAEAIQGFAGARTPEEVELPPEARLGAVVTDLNVAEVLLAAGIAAHEVNTEFEGRDMLRTSVEHLQDDLAAERIRGGAVPGFTDALPPAAPREHSRAALAETFQKTVDTVVDGTLTVLEEAWQRLRALPAGLVSKTVTAVDAVLDVAPQVGRFLRLGLQAVKRALLSLFELLPETVKEAVRERARTLWEASGDGLQRTVVSRLVGAPEVVEAVRVANVSGSPPQDLDGAIDELRALSARFSGLVHTFSRVLRALAAALAVATLVAAVVAAVAAWLPLAAASGYLLAAGSIIVIARDYLDTSGRFARIAGVKETLTRLGPV
ncbi:hypothetical protein ACI78T_13785 [Blastococcus sp. SYSU D00922]